MDDPWDVMAVIRQLSAVVLTFALLVGHLTACGGWAATPEARMACCADEAQCPMHDEHGDRHGVSQAQADSCCAMSEAPQPNPAGNPAAAAITHAVLGPSIVLPVAVPARVLNHGWRTVAPVPSSPVARHILLSVFLI